MDIQEMKNIKPNSHKAKAMAEKKEIKPVVSGTARTKKKSGLLSLKNEIIAEDASNVGSYIVKDVLIPAARNIIIDIITDSANMIFGGGTGNRSGRRSGNSAPYVSYRNYSEPRNRSSENTVSRQRFDCDDIVFASKQDAEAVLGQMIDIMNNYDGVVTVADLYDLADLTQPYTSNRYGWTSLRSASTQRVRDGYILKLPKPMPID